MLLMIAGLVLFLGVHSVRIVADGFRSAQIARHGAGTWKIGYSLVSLAGFVLIVMGYAAARGATPLVWMPPTWARHVALPLTWIAFVLVVAAYVPGTKLKAAVHHPMVLGVKTWAFAHLLANGTLVDVVLFGSFLAWAIVDFAASRRRDRVQGTLYPPGTLKRDALAVLIGTVAWLVFALWLHRVLIGVSPLH